ncbi:sigma-70 family RNA polymerase sigma factor [Sphingobacterium daejeonense]|uniref:RNA polymerase sigma factor n=1 Tax=Sphingobacterium daejeonense TaxID=371142 RepID=UPI0021A30E61|nr:sigma-70 family RNA polymerase sigma factor [Sphingobacterium daejeonense]MCT1532690.1 sigma-70 family RNA polymerase sigma factor [Sphingobacterium daejeonense]
MQEIIDQQLFFRISQSDPQAFEEFHNRFYADMLRLTIMKIGDVEESYDLLQDLFIELWEKRESLSITNSLDAYMRNRLWFKIATYFRSKGFKQNHIKKFTEFLELQEKSPFDQHEVMEINLQYEEMINKVNEVITNMPEKMKAVFILSKEEQLSINSIAEKMNLSPKTVKNHLHAALKRIRSELNDYSPVAVEIAILFWFINS